MLEAERRHGYKGAFERAATEARADLRSRPGGPRVPREVDPWALHGVAEQLLEAVDRTMWAERDPALLAELQQAYLDTEGDLEGEDTLAQDLRHG